MNNAKIAFDNIEIDDDTSVGDDFLEKQQGALAQVIEVINRVEVSADWQKLKALVLDGVAASLERQLAAEASKSAVDLPNLYRLQGQVAWARKYADLKKLADVFKLQLESIKNQLRHE